jgi:hypothetical protein
MRRIVKRSGAASGSAPPLVAFAACSADPPGPLVESYGDELAAEVAALRIDARRRMQDWRAATQS